MGIAKFEKVSFDQFYKDWVKAFPEDYEEMSSDKIKAHVVEIYRNIKLPKRSTKGSAGYDFFSPCNLFVRYGDSITIPTGIRCKMEPGWVLMIYPRSGMGFKYGIRLSNSTAVIDEDYYGADNEGHIHIKMLNDCGALGHKVVEFPEDKAFAQGVFLPYGITEDDEANGERTGGFGSTDK